MTNEDAAITTQSDQAYVKTVATTELRKLWNQNERLIVESFRGLDFGRIHAGINRKWNVLYPEFVARGKRPAKSVHFHDPNPLEARP